MDFLKTLIDTALNSEHAADERVNELRTRIQQALGDAAHKGLDLGELEAATVEDFDGRYNGGEYDPADVDTLEALADITDAVRAEKADQDAAKAERDERVNALSDRIKSKPKNTAEDDEDESDGDGEDETPEDVPEDGESDLEAPETGEVPADAEPVAVAASGRRKRNTVPTKALNAARKSQPVSNRRALRSYSITAAADVPDTATGKSMTMEELTQATLARFRSMPIGQPGVGEVRKSIANVNRVVDESLIADGQNPVRDAEIVDRVSDETRLPGGSLVAAAYKAAQDQQNLTAADAGIPVGGAPPNDIWCSPSETDFSLCEPLATRTGILDLPSFQVRRGGLRYPRWQQYPDQHRPPEHGNPNDQPQGLYAPQHDPGPYDGKTPYTVPGDPADPTGADVPPGHQNTAYTNPNISDGPRHDWHGYVDTNARVNEGEWLDEFPDDLQHEDFYVYNPKKFIEGPCVAWDEQRLHNSYLAIQGDILREHTYPELAQRFISDALISHAHYLNELYIKWIVAHSDRLDPFYANAPMVAGPGDSRCRPQPGPLSLPWQGGSNAFWPGNRFDHGSNGYFPMGSPAEAVLERIGYLVTWFRNTYRTPFTQSWEGFAPFWFREFLKLDIERKVNRPHNVPVSNAEVDAYLAQWGVRLQWVYDWQDVHSDEKRAKYDLTYPTHIMPRDGWPNAVDIVLYPAGSWTLAEQNIMRLDAYYTDAEKLRQNKYTALFVEDGWMLLNKCSRSFVVPLRNLCPNGAVGNVGHHDYPCSDSYISEAKRETILCPTKPRVTPQDPDPCCPPKPDPAPSSDSDSSGGEPQSDTRSNRGTKKQ